MRTVGSARVESIEELKRAQVKSPALTADLLIGFVLGWDRVRVISHCEAPLPPGAWERIHNLILRRATGEPLQYITGEQEFYGLRFHVAPGVLIPRPETEILVEKAIALMRSFSAPRFADVGAGSGCISVAIAHQVPSAAGWAIDISAEALEIARGNAARHGVGERILLVRSDRLSCFPACSLFHFIFSNPPYVPLKDCDSLPIEVRNYEPHAALFGGESGLDFYESLIPEASPRLIPGGYLLLELGVGQAEAVRRLVEREGLSVESVLSDLQSIPRCLVARK